MTKIKLCGLTSRQDIEKANELMPDYIGFVFAPNSKRYVTPQQANKLKKELNENIEAVGVFVDEKPENIISLLENNTIQTIQLHGHEDDMYILTLRQLTKAPIIQAFKIENAEDIEQAQNSLADFVLLDAGTGGTGKTFKWSLISELKRPYFLAGGLNIRNIQKAIQFYTPYAVDVSSGIETNGQKDPQKMTRFVHTIKITQRKDI